MPLINDAAVRRKQRMHLAGDRLGWNQVDDRARDRRPECWSRRQVSGLARCRRAIDERRGISLRYGFGLRGDLSLDDGHVWERRRGDGLGRGRGVRDLLGLFLRLRLLLLRPEQTPDRKRRALGVELGQHALRVEAVDVCAALSSRASEQAANEQAQERCGESSRRRSLRDGVQRHDESCADDAADDGADDCPPSRGRARMSFKLGREVLESLWLVRRRRLHATHIGIRVAALERVFTDIGA